MLSINGLHVSIQDEKQQAKTILRGLSLHIKPGEVHTIMGPNGSGKSTLANVLAGRTEYQVHGGHVALNGVRKQRGLSPLDAADFLTLVKAKAQEVGLNEAFLQRAVNEGFSGGEKKRNEILQMLLLEPRFVILDETDSGLDIDALQMVAQCVNRHRNAQRSVLVVTHYQRLLDYIVPDVVHVMVNGRILKSGDKSLALELEAKGYGWLEAGEIR